MLKKLTLAGAVCGLSAGSAFAHATLEQGEAALGPTYKAVFRVPHGCEGKPTIVVRVQIPEGVIAVKPMPKAGWKLEKVRGAYAKSYDYHGTPTTEGVKEIVWSGGSLPDDEYDEFVLRGTSRRRFQGRRNALLPDRPGMPGRRGRALDRDPLGRPIKR